MGLSDLLPFRPVWIQSNTSSSSPRLSPLTIRPVRSAYRSSFACAACITSDVAVLPLTTPAFNALPGAFIVVSVFLLAASLVERVFISERAAVRDAVSSSTLASRLAVRASLKPSFCCAISPSRASADCVSSSIRSCATSSFEPAEQIWSDQQDRFRLQRQENTGPHYERSPQLVSSTAQNYSRRL